MLGLTLRAPGLMGAGGGQGRLREVHDQIAQKEDHSGCDAGKWVETTGKAEAGGPRRGRTQVRGDEALN